MYVILYQTWGGRKNESKFNFTITRLSFLASEALQARPGIQDLFRLNEICAYDN